MSKTEQLYSELIFAINLVSYEYQTSNPIIIAEKIQQDLGIEYSIHQIADQLSVINEDYEKENRKHYYSLSNN